MAESTIVLGGEGYSTDLILALVQATDAAAVAARSQWAHHDKDGADEAAVAAMRSVLLYAPFDGTVVIGEGEKDAAPMLANGERLGAGGRAYDIAVDPLDGTRLVAEGLPGSIAVIALAPSGTMFDPVDVFYMDKLICSAAGRDVVDIRRPVAENVRALADAVGRPQAGLVVAVLDKPRHAKLIAEIWSTGATVRLIGEGDISAAVSAASGEIHLALGIGGTPEGIVAACAVRALGGFMQGRLAPQNATQVENAMRAGHDLERVLELDDLVNSDDVLFVMTPV
jgi:fructose-1,6-bisphosphatase II